jgi:hypothetical protein
VSVPHPVFSVQELPPLWSYIYISASHSVFDTSVIVSQKVMITGGEIVIVFVHMTGSVVCTPEEITTEALFTHAES